jgi:hypothetical protein
MSFKRVSRLQTNFVSRLCSTETCANFINVNEVTDGHICQFNDRDLRSAGYEVKVASLNYVLMSCSRQIIYGIEVEYTVSGLLPIN